MRPFSLLDVCRPNLTQIATMRGRSHLAFMMAGGGLFEARGSPRRNEQGGPPLENQQRRPVQYEMRRRDGGDDGLGQKHLSCFPHVCAFLAVCSTLSHPEANGL